MSGEDAYILGMDYVDETLKGAGALKGQDGKDGVSPVISVNTSTSDTYKLDITDKNGTITTPNLVGKQGLQGIQGEQGKPADNPIITENVDNTEDVYKLDLTVGETVFTTKNIIGKQGLEGVSPSVTTNPDNTAEDYRLNITTKGGTFTTPNLRGPQGEIGPQGESAASAINPRGDYDVNAEPHYTISDYITSAEGNTYVCKKDNPGNVAPTDGTVNDEFWQVLALRGAKGEEGKDGEKGADGVTFTPSIDESGVLSFTNNGGLENPEPIDIKGDNGVTFTPSIDADGYLSWSNDGNLENPEPIKVLGKDGVDGKDGADGTTYIPSIGTVTTVESNADASVGVTVDEETKEAVFNFAIPKGENGAEGFSPIVTITETDNGHNVSIEDVNGVQNFEVLDGKDAELSQYGLVTNAQNFKIDLTKNNAYWYGMFTFNFVYGTTPCEITVTITDKVYYTITKGQNVVSAITYTQDGANYTIGIDLTAKIYGTQVVEMPTEFGVVNSFTAETYAGDTTANLKLDSAITYTTLAELGLTADATFQDVVDALPKGASALLGVKEFTNYQTIFPYEEGNDQFARVHIVKGVANGSSMYARWFRKDGIKEAIAKFNINDNKFDGWQEIAIKPITELTDLGLDGSATIQNVMDKMSVGQHCIINTSRFNDKTEVNNIEYGKVEIRRLSSGMWSLWLEDVLHGSTVAHGTCSASKFAGWHYFTTKDYVDNLIANLQAQIDELKSKIN